MQDNTESTPKPSREQMRRLRALADQRGTSFAWPDTAAQADAQIELLAGRKPSSHIDRFVDRRAVSTAMAKRGGASAIRDSEIVGYGSSAHWAVGQ